MSDVRSINQPPLLAVSLRVLLPTPALREPVDPSSPLLLPRLIFPFSCPLDPNHEFVINNSHTRSITDNITHHRKETLEWNLLSVRMPFLDRIRSREGLEESTLRLRFFFSRLDREGSTSRICGRAP